MFNVNLRKYLLSDEEIARLVRGDRIHYATVPQGITTDYVWFAQSFSGEERSFSDQPGDEPFRRFVDIECYSLEAWIADALTDLIRKKDSYRGDFGEATVQGIFTSDHADDYVPRGLSVGADEGLFVGDLRMEIIGYEE